MKATKNLMLHVLSIMSELEVIQMLVPIYNMMMKTILKDMLKSYCLTKADFLQPCFTQKDFLSSNFDAARANSKVLYTI